MLEENVTPLYVRKKIYHQKFGEKSSYTSQITHTPRQKWNGRPLSATFLEVKVKACFFGDILLAKKCKFRWPWQCQKIYLSIIELTNR